MLLVEHIRAELGLPTRGLGWGRHIGWTTSREKAEAVHALGAHVELVRANLFGPLLPGDDPNRIVGYEFSFAVGRELEEANDAGA